MRPAHPRERNQFCAGSSPAVDCWVFDVDGCLVDSLTGTSLRPGARELLAHLGSGSRVILWSAGGADYARARAEQFGVDRHISGYYAKDERNGDGCYVTGHLALHADRAVFVDDRPEDLGPELEVMAVSPYLSEDTHDRALEAVARRTGLAPPNPIDDARELREARGPIRPTHS
jgi:long-chain acyl-CoA synthetase